MAKIFLMFLYNRLHQLCLLRSSPASCRPRGPARLVHKLPTPKPRCGPVLRRRPRRGWRPRLPHTHHIHRHNHKQTQAHNDTEAIKLILSCRYPFGLLLCLLVLFWGNGFSSCYSHTNLMITTKI